MALCLWFLCLLLGWTESAKILTVMVGASTSHHIWMRPIVHELATKGHDVTYFSVVKDKDFPPNVRQVYAEGVYDKLHGAVDLEEMVQHQSPLELMYILDGITSLTCQLVFDTKGFDQLLEIIKKEKFDLFIIDYLLSECLLPIADLLGDTPIIGASAYGGTPLPNHYTGNTETLAIRPNNLLPFTNNMTFLERVQNVLLHHYYYFSRKTFLLPGLMDLTRTKFPDVKDLDSIQQRFSLFLVNAHHSFDAPLPTLPNIINVGGLHVKPGKPLPKDLQTFLDGAKDGAIFFSLGSNVKSSNLSKEKRQILINVFKKLAPIRVLWKFEVDLPEKPSNVMIGKWLPQSDILAHPNVKVFFTHSGLLSTQESFYHGKPVVGMPFLGDQFSNIMNCVRRGVGEKVDFRDMTEESLYGTLKTVLDNPKYSEKAQLISRVLRDQPQTPLESAMFWIEYVIRHKGANHLRCPSLNLTWYQNELLDVYAVLAATLLSLLFLFVFLLKSIYRVVVGGEKKKIKKN